MSDQPKSTGEWTVRIKQILTENRLTYDERIQMLSDEINAALAAERERYKEVHSIAVEKDRLWSEACNRLAAEREKWEYYQDVARANGCESVTDALVQLKHLRDKLLQFESFGEQLADQQTANQQLRGQLAAEREKAAK